MSENIVMPKWGLTMKQGKLTKWFKQEGDAIEKGEVFFEVETEKITNTVESTAGGFVFQIAVPEGSTVPVGTVVAIVAAEGEQPERIEGIQAGEAKAEQPKEAAKAKTAEPAEKKFIPATPSARRVAKELGVDLASVPGTGPEGRVTEGDVKKFHEEGPPPPKATPLAAEMARQSGINLAEVPGTGEGGKITKEDVERFIKGDQAAGEAEAPAEAAPSSIPFSGMRRAIADNMQASLANAAQLTAFVEIDVTETARFLDLVREEYKKDDKVRVSYNDIIILAVSRALKKHPIMNSTLVEDEILLHDSVNMGVAVALPEGLIVPVLRDADKMGLLQIAAEARGLAGRARENALTVDEVTGGTFTITNTSMFEVDGFTPILKAPETGILGVGQVKEKPAVHEGEIKIRKIMTISLTYDHRVVDGAPAHAFLQTVGRYLKQPYLIMT